MPEGPQDCVPRSQKQMACEQVNESRRRQFRSGRIPNVQYSVSRGTETHRYPKHGTWRVVSIIRRNMWGLFRPKRRSQDLGRLQLSADFISHRPEVVGEDPRTLGRKTEPLMIQLLHCGELSMHRRRKGNNPDSLTLAISEKYPKQPLHARIEGERRGP